MPVGALVVIVTWAASSGPDLGHAAPAGPVTATGSFEQLRERGRRAYRAKKFGEARQLLSAASTMRPDDGEVLADLALCLQQLGMSDDAIAANRKAIRLASRDRAGRGPRARRIRRAAYFNLGKLGAGRALSLDGSLSDHLTCLSLASEPDCARPLFVCGGSAFETYPDLGAAPQQTRDRSDADAYDITLALESEVRRPSPGEAAITVSQSSASCALVHADACSRRIGLYCEWDSWAEGVTSKPRAAAVELTFTPGDPP
jgi:hypothetical protein